MTKQRSFRFGVMCEQMQTAEELRLRDIVDPRSLYQGTLRRPAGPADCINGGRQRHQDPQSWKPGARQRLPTSGDAGERSGDT